MARKPTVRKSSEGGEALTTAVVKDSPPVEAPREAGDPEIAWPLWARRLVTVVLAVHIAAVVFGSLGVPPSSLLQRWLADRFVWHHGLLDQGYAYRYYAEPPPTPVVVATLHGADGREETVRIPDRELAGPPMRRQRQLALANALFASARSAHHGHPDEEEGGARESWLARSYARHLCRTHPGTLSVTLRAQQHLMPAPDRVLEFLEGPGGDEGGFDLFDESLFTTPRWIGDFPCDGY